MKEIVRINLENEMDLILVHRRSMKLAELCGLSLIQQTTFATAVSEVARCVIDSRTLATFSLSLVSSRGGKKEMAASISAGNDFIKHNQTAYKYAAKLSNRITVDNNEQGTTVKLFQQVSFGGLINDAKIDSFVTYFQKEIPVTPYDELRKKNIQLIELSEKLRDRENQYKTLTEKLPLMMFTTNASGYLTYANKWLKDFFGLGDIEPGKVFWLSFLHTGSSRKVRDEWENAVINQLPLKIEAELKSKTAGADPVWHLISVLPVKSESGKAEGWTGFFVDIHAQKVVEDMLRNNSELKAAQKQILATQVKLEEKISDLNKSNHDLEQFAYIASHDLQEPLRKIRSFTEMLEANINVPEQRKKYLDKIDNATERMSNLIKDVLDYSKLSKAETSFDPTDLNEILRIVKSDLDMIVQEKKAKILSDNLPTIIGIKPQLYQLFYNLIKNSLKFNTEEPIIKIHSRALTQEEIKANENLHISYRYIELKFADNGIGFESKYANQIFTIFKRLNTKDKFTGTGIGLALCKKIVDNHHGVITATSELGKGAEFSIILPVE